MVLQKDTENSICRTSKQSGSLKENGNKNNAYAQNQEQTVEITRTHNVEGEFVKLNPHGAYTNGKKARGMQNTTHLASFCKYLLERDARPLAKVEKLLRATRRHMISHVLTGRGV